MSLGSRLTYRPKELQFGTSGRRGLVTELTQLEVYINVLAELEYLQSLPPEAGSVLAVVSTKARGNSLIALFPVSAM